MNVMSDSVPAVASRPSPNPSPSLAVRSEAEALFVGPTHDTKRGFLIHLGYFTKPVEYVHSDLGENEE